jgi:hypothetical protein
MQAVLVAMGFEKSAKPERAHANEAQQDRPEKLPGQWHTLAVQR